MLAERRDAATRDEVLGALGLLWRVPKKSPPGYGKIKGTTFRISNMGDETPATMQQLFAALDSAMAKL